MIRLNIEFMLRLFKMKKTYLISLLIFLLISCKTIDRKIDNLSNEIDVISQVWNFSEIYRII